MKPRSLLATLTVAGAAALAAVPAASDAAVSPASAVSENWSGYAVGNPSGSGQFSSVAGSWVEPTVDCSSGSGYAAFWVGLGGTDEQNQALEKVGTQAACAGSGAAEHFAWYELVPAGPVQLDVAIHPGDHVSARVTVEGTSVTVWLRDDATGDATTKTLAMSNPDVSTAEWIAEAPSQCDGSGNCQALPLANFGSVNFTSATATADDHTGSIADPSWNTQAVDLQPGSQFVSSAGASSQAGAQPSSLSSDGSSFSVQWQGNSASGYNGYPGGDGYRDGYGGYPYAYGY